MKLGKMIFLVIIINLLFIFAGFAINNDDISTLETSLAGNFNSSFNAFDNFHTETTKSDNFLLKLTSDVVQGISNTINLVTIGIQLVGLVLGLYVSPLTLIGNGYGNDIEPFAILRIMGLIGVMFLWWFNIRMAIKIYLVIKGSDS